MSDTICWAKGTDIEPYRQSAKPLNPKTLMEHNEGLEL